MTSTDRFTNWRKSSRSNPQSNCVEVAHTREGDVGLRDSKDGGRGPILEFTPSEWRAFVAGVKDGEFDLH